MNFPAALLLALLVPAHATEPAEPTELVLEGEPTAAASEAEALAPYLEALPAAPEGCHLRASEGRVLIDCGGHALLVAAGDGTRSGLLALMDEQTEPFSTAGLQVSGRTEVACSFQGETHRCLRQTVGIPGGAEMSLLGALEGEGAFTALCLRRGEGKGDPCSTVVRPL